MTLCVFWLRIWLYIFGSLSLYIYICVCVCVCVCVSVCVCVREGGREGGR